MIFCFGTLTLSGGSFQDAAEPHIRVIIKYVKRTSLISSNINILTYSPCGFIHQGRLMGSHAVLPEGLEGHAH